MLKTSLKHFLLIFLITCSNIILAQDYSFKNFNSEEGIIHPFTYAINQDQNGYLWISTGNGLCLFDGIKFLYPKTDSITEAIVNVFFKDSDNILWFGHSDGSISYYNGQVLTMFQNDLTVHSPIVGITEIHGKLIFATQMDGLLVKSGNKLTQIKDPFLDKTPSSIYGKKNMLYLGTQEGLFVYKFFNNDSLSLMFNPQELEYVNIQCLTMNSDSIGIWVGTQDQGVYIFSNTDDNYFLKKVGVDIGLENKNIQYIYHNKEHDLWICTYSGVYKIKTPDVGHSFRNYVVYNKDNGLQTNYIKQVFVDAEENVWIATYGEGIEQLQNESLVVYPSGKLNDLDNIVSLEMADSLLYLGGNGIISVFSRKSKRIVRSYTKSNNLPDVEVTSLNYEDSTKTLWIGTNGAGVYRMVNNKIGKYFASNINLGNKVNDILIRGNKLIVATVNGIYVIDRETKDINNYATTEGLPYNNIISLYRNINNEIVLATRSNGVYALDENYDIVTIKETANFELDIKDITYDKQGNLWVATYLNGVVGFLGDSLVNITKETGLINNYCYSIITDSKNDLWVGHRSGISKVNLDNFQIEIFNNDNGINGGINTNASISSKDDQLFFGSTKGLVSFNLNNEKINTTPPFANILNVEIADEIQDHTKPIVMPFKTYKIRINYIGISLSDPENVAYQYKLEGLDLEWSEITDRTDVTYTLKDGEYTFLLKAYNSHGYSNPVPVKFSLVILKPIWKQWWFIFAVVLILILSIVFIIKYRERKQKELQEYLQRSLDERTKEVIEQKEEIELKNRDITDSINYAQRIQESILPPIKKLQEHFSGCFVFYQPRNIVSGDFYWFDYVGNDRFIIVCADSTGHGVPGAFMSMIGTTLIKDICMRSYGSDTPNEILQVLDKELSMTLNQNVDAEKPSDGMDIIVCEVNLKTNYVKYASAMRPLIFYKNGEQMYIKGSRSSIGGQYTKGEKDFEGGGIQFSKGDIIYMFSDGYPDQFGGPMGKKFKMVRLKNLLRDIHQKPMDEQYNYVKSTFNLWKEDLEQVDDVLFMGIKL